MKGIKASPVPSPSSPSSLLIKCLDVSARFEVSVEMRVDATLRYFRILVELLDEREALHKTKKIGSWFTKGVPNGVAFRQKLQQMNEPAVLMAELEALKHGAAA